MHLSDQEKLCVAQAFYKAAGALVSTKGGDSLRAAVDEQMVGMYAETGAKTFDMKVGGQKVGTYSVRVKAAEDGVRLDVEDPGALLAWAIENGCATVDMKKVQERFDATGELPDGCKATRWQLPERVDGTTLRIDELKVAEALGASLPEAMGSLLLPEGGSDA